MTTTQTTAQTSLPEVLQRRFPEADFEVAPPETGTGLSISWDGPPNNEAVMQFLRAAGLIANSSPNLPGHVRVQSPRTQPRTTQRPPSGNPGGAARALERKKQPPVSFGAQGLWSISDLEVIRETAERWVCSLTRGGTIAYYTAGMSFLMIATGYLAWVLDIQPSLIFGQHLAAQLASEWVSLKLLTAVIFLLSITPNLLEFFATGLAAHGNVIVDITIKAALLFDAATDAPMAYSISKAFVGFFVSEPTGWSGLIAVLMAIPILLFSTVVVEILFLSFLTTFVLLIRRSFSVRRPSRRSYGR